MGPAAADLTGGGRLSREACATTSRSCQLLCPGIVRLSSLIWIQLLASRSPGLITASPDLLHGAQEEEENGIGDVDLFTLMNHEGGLEVNAKWLQHLQERLLGEDGHPRKVLPSHSSA